jgi:hypothetical protein
VALWSGLSNDDIAFLQDALKSMFELYMLCLISMGLKAPSKSGPIGHRTMLLRLCVVTIFLESLIDTLVCRSFSSAKKLIGADAGADKSIARQINGVGDFARFIHRLHILREQLFPILFKTYHVSL